MSKTPEKRASAGRANALQKPLQPSEELAAVVGSGPLPRGQVVTSAMTLANGPSFIPRDEPATGYS
jgi:hypothetical protein